MDVVGVEIHYKKVEAQKPVERLTMCVPIKKAGRLLDSLIAHCELITMRYKDRSLVRELTYFVNHERFY